ncbi:MAG TPA: T9SS type A sorting domain-containing protein, partial [Saprospiraceae bacterium]|nr:T9SS type A sorting domain-containing protein [Saprospiraceae bacterium]
PMIDKGIHIPGFYDFKGAAPDLGAKESTSVSSYHPAQDNTNIHIYPNPTSGEVNVLFEEKVAYVHLTIHNTVGQMVSSSSYSDTDQLQFFIAGSPGTYFVTVDDSGKERYVLKIVKW